MRDKPMPAPPAADPPASHAAPTPAWIANSAPVLTGMEESLLLEAFRSTWISSKGPFLQAFEEGLEAYFGRTYACAVSSGTAALHLALKAIGVGPGDEVIVPDLTYIAVASAVVYCGATPVLADVHPRYGCIDPASVEGAISRRTRAIIAVHGFGHPADLDALLGIAERRGIAVVEDVCQAFGARERGRLAGTRGLAAVHSFFANKIITTGEGGALVTDDPDLKHRADLLRSHCESPDRKFLHTSVGFNYRMTNLQAAIGCGQLRRVDAILERRRVLLSWYRDELAGMEGAVLNPREAWADPVNWQVCLLLEGREPGEVHAFRARMRELGIDIRPAFVPLHAQPALAGLARAHGGRVAQDISSRMIMLPSGGDLGRDAVSRICAEARKRLA